MRRYLESDPHRAQGRLAAGLPDIILHGSANITLALREVINRNCNADPTRIKRYAGQFRGMVIPGTDVTVSALETRQEGGDEVIFYEMRNDQGELAIANGVVVASASLGLPLRRDSNIGVASQVNQRSEEWSDMLTRLTSGLPSSLRLVRGLTSRGGVVSVLVVFAAVALTSLASASEPETESGPQSDDAWL